MSSDQRLLFTGLEEACLPVACSRIAERESWRKELHRPVTYVHKWWARRLGSVFRHLLLAAAELPCTAGLPSNLMSGLVVYDPFAGSGTTLVEAAKLGARVVGCDINPIATLTQRQALLSWSFAELDRLFSLVDEGCRADVDALHIAVDGLPVLHYFWVAVTSCTTCSVEVELFSSYVFAKHAYPQRVPQAHATCPQCHAVCGVTLGEDEAGHCSECGMTFDLAGPVMSATGSGRYFRCPDGHRSSVIDALGQMPPKRRMYAKAVRNRDGSREYRAIDDYDIELYERAAKLLADAAPGSLVRPDGELAAGRSTAQAIRWGYRTWESFFNDRQLYCLGRIAAAIRDLPGDSPEREALAASFGKTLEHHNLFCSFKGEGTGPVRSIFHNHVLRPERCSVEGNPWGTGGGSGGFAEALNRLEKAQRYKSSPTDLVEQDGKVVTLSGQSRPIGYRIADTWDQFVEAPGTAYVVTGDASCTDLPDGSVSMVITDPPYVDNVHYSELADFFHAWMRPIRPHSAYLNQDSTRDAREVQNTSALQFRTMAARVWTECVRVLRDDGILVFSFHQSRSTGWQALMASLKDANLVVTATRPVIAEVATSLAKVAAAAPNRIDVIVVCRKRELASVPQLTPEQARADALGQLQNLHDAGLLLGTGDVLSAVRASVLAQGTRASHTNWAEQRSLADEQADLALAAWSSHRMSAE